MRQDHYDTVVAALVAKTKRLKKGNPLQPDCFVGPLISEVMLTMAKVTVAVLTMATLTVATLTMAMLTMATLTMAMLTMAMLTMAMLAMAMLARAHLAILRTADHHGRRGDLSK